MLAKLAVVALDDGPRLFALITVARRLIRRRQPTRWQRVERRTKRPIAVPAQFG
jgi:hypothetical protein